MRAFNSSPRFAAGGVIATIVGLALVGIGNVASAEPAQQTAATATPVACVATRAGLQIVLENPQPFDTLLSGTIITINGIAFDTTAPTGSGVSAVSVYLGDRDAGGPALGVALLGQPNQQAGAGTQFANAGFTLMTTTLPAGSGSRTIFVYARSSVNNAEAVLQVPVYLNTAPTPVKGQVPTAVLAPPPACTPTPAPTATAVPAPTSPPAADVVVPLPPTPAIALLVTPTPFPTLAPLPAPAAAAPAPAAAAAPRTVASVVPAPVAPVAAQATAPRGGGIPSELGLLILGAGALVAGGGLALRRRQRGAGSPPQS
jgi:hypothetical protein